MMVPCWANETRRDGTVHFGHSTTPFFKVKVKVKVNVRACGFLTKKGQDKFQIWYTTPDPILVPF